jgi:MFS family permease
MASTANPEPPASSRLANASRMLSALQYPHFRRFWLGNLGAVSGQQIMWVAQGWLVYQLTDSPVYLGYVGLATALPAIILNLAGGVLADRMDQRKVIVATQLITAASVFALATLTAVEAVHVWQVLAVAFTSGCMQAFNNPARQSIFPALVPRADLMNAVALNSMVWQATRIVAPATGGALIAVFGVATGLYVCAVGFLVLALAVIGLPAPQTRTRSAGESVLGDLNVGISFIRANFLFAFLIGMSFFNSFFGFSTNQMMPVFAKDILHVGSWGQGVMLSITGVGAMLGILAIGYLGDTERKGLLIIGGASLFGAFIILFAVSTFFPLSLLALFLMGAAGSIYMITVQTSLQMRVPDELRGRVMGIYGVTHNIGPLGAMQAGLLASAFSAPVALSIGGLAIILFALGVAYSRRDVRALQTVPAPVAA